MERSWSYSFQKVYHFPWSTDTLSRSRDANRVKIWKCDQPALNPVTKWSDSFSSSTFWVIFFIWIIWYFEEIKGGTGRKTKSQRSYGPTNSPIVLLVFPLGLFQFYCKCPVEDIFLHKKPTLTLLGKMWKLSECVNGGGLDVVWMGVDVAVISAVITSEPSSPVTTTLTSTIVIFTTNIIVIITSNIMIINIFTNI